MSRNVLYWPGWRRERDELAFVWDELARRGLSVGWIDAPYDSGRFRIAQRPRSCSG